MARLWPRWKPLRRATAAGIYWYIYCRFSPLACYGPSRCCAGLNVELEPGMPNLLTRLSEWTNARRKLVWLMLFVLVVVVIAIVLTPVFLIMPFKAQTPRAVEISYLMRRWSPVVTVVGLLAILTFTIGLWFGGRWWSRVFMLILLVPTLGAMWLARQNHFEW